MKKKVCKWCGKEHGDLSAGDMCSWCRRRRAQCRRFAKERDKVRVLCGLEPLGKQEV